MDDTPFKILKKSLIRREDDRGHLDILYEVEKIVLKRSFSRAGVFRGMHWQRPPYEQIKIIRVLKGKIIDFVADPMERPTTIHYRELDMSNGWVKIGSNYAHGFYAIEDTDFEYFCIGEYNETAESNFSIVTILKNELGLTNLIISEKDASASSIVDFNILKNT